MKALFLRLLDADDKATALKSAIDLRQQRSLPDRFDIELMSFSMIPGSPFAYWAGKELRRIFRDLPRFESHDRTAKQGLTTADDDRFARLWWEVPASNLRSVWFPFAKGGAFAPFYADVHLVVNWAKSGREIYEFNGIPFGAAGAPLRNPSFYFRPGLTWPHRSALFSSAAFPADSIFSSSGKAAFVPTDQLLFSLGVFNSSAFALLLRIQSDAVRIKFECGLVSQTPMVHPDGRDALRVGDLALLAWSTRRSIDSCNERSHA
ncbi:MAG TPA: hypothetical protein VFC46_10445, partial [Humisphaera sp.]|nr:hypothetical protein [Humisphaera sp.]